MVDHDEALAKLDERLARRITLALTALGRDGAIYAEDGAEPPFSGSSAGPSVHRFKTLQSLGP